ncbi:MAG: gluconokinase [Variovorax sp.]|nr:gluconokinase [Variovorax sp.]
MTVKVLVMGVSGCGKSTVAVRLASALGARLIEGDDFHLPSSQRKMRDGIPLNDNDRWPWLDQLGALLSADTGSAVLTCSALKRAYRDRLRAAVPSLRIVYIEIAPDDARARVAARTGHLFPASLVANQFATLESPVGESNVLSVAAAQPVEAQLGAAIDWLGHVMSTASAT